MNPSTDPPSLDPGVEKVAVGTPLTYTADNGLDCVGSGKSPDARRRFYWTEVSDMKKHPGEDAVIYVRMQAKEFVVPPVRDCLVIGKKSPIGCVALKKALSLLHGAPFEDLHPDDDNVGDILVRASILRKIPREKFVDLVLKRVKPLMDDTEVVELGIEVELLLEDKV